MATRGEAEHGADWELSKENVQPLRQGRRVAVLNSSLHPSGDDAVSRRAAEQRRVFELEIRTYSGEDPLDPWQRYIQWAEQHYPRGGHEGHMDKLIENCISLFRNETRYHQDARYVRLWINMAQSSQVPLEVFQFMFHHDIGTQLAMLYTGWAWHQELAGSLARADAVLAEGGRRAAEPVETMAEARRKLQERVAADVVAGKLQAPLPAQRQQPEGRQALGELRGAKPGAAPHVRVGSSVMRGQPGPMPFSSGGARSNRGLQVYQDQSSGSHMSQQQSGRAAAAVPTAAHKEKENMKRAGPWNSPSAAAASPVRPISRGRMQLTQSAEPRTARSAASAAFQVHVDESAAVSDSGASTTAANPGALSMRSVSTAVKTTDDGWNPPVAIFDPPNPSVRVMYCKDLIYAGAAEVSFEELRSVEWLKRNRIQMEQVVANSDNPRRAVGAVSGGADALDDLLELHGAAPPAAGFAIYEDDKEPDSDKENQPPSSYQPPTPVERRQPMGILVESTSIVNAPVTEPAASPPPTAAARPAVYRQLQLDDELTGFQAPPLQEMSLMAPDPSVFANGASRVSSTPMVAKSSVNDGAEEDFTDNVQYYRPRAKSGSKLAVATGPGGFSPIVEGSCEEKFRSSCSSFDAFSRLSPVNSDSAAHKLAGGCSAPLVTCSLANSSSYMCHQTAGDTLRSGYLGDRSSATPTPHQAASVVDDCFCSGDPGAPTPVTVRDNAVAVASNEQVSVSRPGSELTEVGLTELSLNEQLLPASAAEKNSVLDPWSVALRRDLLESVTPALTERAIVSVSTTALPDFSQSSVRLGADVWRLSPVSDHVFHAVSAQTNQTCCLKVVQDDAHWQVFIVDELTRRLGERAQHRVLSVSRAFLYDDGAVLCSEYHAGGSLLSVRDVWGKRPILTDALPLLFTAEMLASVQLVHSAGVIHGSVELSRFQVRSESVDVFLDGAAAGKLDGVCDGLLELTGFSRAIDTTRFAPGFVFVSDGVPPCPEVLSGRPWTYQLDLFGVAAAAYELLFGVQLQLVASSRPTQRWSVAGDFRRYWRATLWRQFFDEFLNIESCDQLPDLSIWRLRLLQAATVDGKLGNQLSQLLVGPGHK